MCRSCRNARVDIGPYSVFCHHGMCGRCCPRTYCLVHGSSASAALRQVPPSRDASPRPTSRNGSRPVTPQGTAKLCSTCGHPDHKSTSCIAAQKKAQRSCDFCGRSGHMVANCWHARKKHSTVPAGIKQNDELRNGHHGGGSVADPPRHRHVPHASHQQQQPPCGSCGQASAKHCAMAMCVMCCSDPGCLRHGVHASSPTTLVLAR